MISACWWKPISGPHRSSRTSCYGSKTDLGRNRHSGAGRYQAPRVSGGTSQRCTGSIRRPQIRKTKKGKIKSQRCHSGPVRTAAIKIHRPGPYVSNAKKNAGLMSPQRVSKIVFHFTKEDRRNDLVGSGADNVGSGSVRFPRCSEDREASR